MKNLVSTLSLGAVLIVAPLAANAAATFDKTTTKTVSVSASLSKPTAVTAEARPTSPAPKATTLVSAETLVDAYNDAINNAYAYVDTQLEAVGLSGGSASLTTAVADVVADLIKKNLNVATSWAAIKNASSTAQQQTAQYFTAD